MDYGNIPRENKAPGRPSDYGEHGAWRRGKPKWSEYGGSVRQELGAEIPSRAAKLNHLIERERLRSILLQQEERLQYLRDLLVRRPLIGKEQEAYRAAVIAVSQIRDQLRRMDSERLPTEDLR